MQSEYGSVSEIQQFMMENCGSSIFSISSATPPNPSVATGAADIHAASSQPLRYRPLHHPHPSHHHHHHQQPQTPSPLPPHFSHFHSIPITQQFFQQSHQFQLFHPQPQEQRRLIPQHQLGLDQESGPENSTGAGGGGGGPSFLAATMNFKLAVNESSGGGSREGLNDEDSILQGDDGSESRLHHHWQREEESAIKEPPWRPLDIDYVDRNNKRCKEKEPQTPTNKYCKKSKEGAEPDAGGHINGSGSNYKLFSELEAIYKPGGSTIVGGGTNRAGSGSALTGDETALMPAATNPPEPATDHLVGGSETSAGEEAPVKKFSKGSGRRKRKRRQQKQLSSITAFFENLVKQLMDHQESLHRKFLEVMERRDQERTVREEAWRRQEAAKTSREAAARAQERALASSREAAIISFLEKITGETLRLPEKTQFQAQFPEEPAETTENLPTEPSNTVNNGDSNANKVHFNTCRWPKAEVHALIRVRSGLESRFQEPGLKGPLWEEVSATMAAMGYHRSAKRCKEKWENINKYFRKTKESGKKRPQHSKTCPYFYQLDQLYSKSLNKSQPASSSSPNANVASATTSGTATDQGKDHSDLLDAIIVSTDQQGFKFPEMSSLHFDFHGKGKDHNELHHKVGNNGEEDDDDDDEEGGGREKADEREEGEGESQVQPHQEEHHPHDSNLFFQCLQS